MELGVHGLNTRAALSGAATARLARRAEQLGYESWWAADHVVLPSPSPPEPMDPRQPILDPLVNLTYVAASTERLRIGTGVVVLPQRNPLVLAKQAASLDVMSSGRLLLGIGGGWLERELAALGVPMAERGARTDEYLAAMTALWTQPSPAFAGSHVSFANVDAYPRPVRPDGPTIVIGGHSPAAFRRAVRRGNGWFGNGTLDDLVAHLDGLAKAAIEVDRAEDLGTLEITFMLLGSNLDADAARRASDLGVDRLLVFALPSTTEAEAAALIERHADLPR